MKSVPFYILYTFSFVFAILPFRILYIISDIYYYIIYYVIRYRRETVFTNLRKSFPEKSEKEITTIARKFYHHICDLFIETIKLLHLSEKEKSKRLKLRNPEILETLYGEHKIIITALGHYNNWEWISALSQRPHFQIASIYKPLKEKNVDRFMFRLRSKEGAILVPPNQTLRFLNGWKEIETRIFFCFIADQSPLTKDIHYWTKFLNQDTPVFIGLEKIATKMNLPVAFFKLHKIKRGYYELEIVPIVENAASTQPNEITEAHVRLLEEEIVKKPEYWLWSHRRWKRKPLMNELNISYNA